MSVAQSTAPESEPLDGQVAIIGAGPAGLTAAYKLMQRGQDTVVFEADSVVGGISRTASEAKRICEYLNIEKNENHLIASIENQSFEKKKKLFEDSNQPEKANFLRKGISEKWKEVLSSKNIKMINNEIGEFLEKLEYK